VNSPYDMSQFEDVDRCSVCHVLVVNDQPCACFDEDGDGAPIEGGVPLSEIPPYSRDQFYEMLMEDDQYGGLLDPDDFENILIATVISLDKKIQELLKKRPT
jgi:hypothetical protein